MIGILEAGAPPEDLDLQSDGYAAMFRRLLGADVLTQTFDVRGDALPAPDKCDGWLITGSASAPYDAEPWIATLSQFVTSVPVDTPIVGICFGHQLLAQALGGLVAPSPKGRALGLHRYDVWRSAPWMDDVKAVSLPVGHVDQVVAVGPDCVVLGGSEFTPFGILTYSSRRAFSIQSHPEFEVDFAQALVRFRREEIGIERADAAAASLSTHNDSRRVAEWLRRFLLSPDSDDCQRVDPPKVA